MTTKADLPEKIDLRKGGYYPRGKVKTIDDVIEVLQSIKNGTGNLRLEVYNPILANSDLIEEISYYQEQKRKGGYVIIH